ncbi:hypothetical protein FQN54_004689 [Arachnomyces sp. PD_36]|nr:hypothetical protein FQN54_004689 [Arachnomyces sp. PD_36]
MWKQTLIIALLQHYAAAGPTLALDTDFADPGIIQTDDGFYAFATSGNGVNIQVANSSDFSSWQLLEGTDALPGPFPSWVGESPSTWAPDVIQRGDGAFVLYFSASAAEDTSKHCLGAAVSTSITGPYTPEESPIACPLDEGGAIDGDGFSDDGTLYITYKVDGNSLNGDGTTHPTPIMLQLLGSDGVTPDGDPVQLLDRDEVDGPLIEAPSLMKSGDTYYLTFSSNMYDSLSYDVSYATSSSITGPFEKAQAPDAPLIVSGDESDVGTLGGPGGADFLQDGSRISFHAFRNGENIDDGRSFYTSGVILEDAIITLE